MTAKEKTKIEKKHRVVRMQDVADHVGISVSTVSRALNGANIVSDKLHKLIEEAVEELGYRRIRKPSMKVAAGNHAHLDMHFGGNGVGTGNIGLVTPDWICNSAADDNHHASFLFSSLLREVEKAGFRLVLMACDETHCEEVPPIIEEKHLDGLIVGFSPSSNDLRWLEWLASELPLVALNTVIPNPPISSVAVDNRMMMYKAVSRLLELGHRRIAFFGIGEDMPNIDMVKNFHALERRYYYGEALRFHGLPVDPELCRSEKFGLDEHAMSIEASMKRMMALSNPPTAIITALGYMPCFFDVATRMGLRIPSDISLLATDESPMANMMPCPLTTISSNHPEGTRLAVEMLLNKIRRGDKGSQAVQIVRYEPLLVERASLASARKNT